MSDVPEPEVSPQPRPRRVSVAELVRGVHQHAQLEPIVMADECGRFPSVVPHDVFPLVIDANVLRDEILRTVRAGERTVLCNAANSGVFRLFCAEHAVKEVDEHLATWAAKKNLDLETARQVWAEIYRPLLRLVEVPSGLTTSQESDRLHALATIGGPHSDPDDVPTATLSVLIGAPLLSKDNNALRAVYGEDFDRTARKQWLGALAAGGDLGPLGTYMRLMGLAVAGPIYLAYTGTKALGRRYDWQLVGLVSLGIGLALIAYVPVTRWRRIRASAWRVLEPALLFFAEALAVEATARAQFQSLTSPKPAWSDVVAEIGATRALTRKCLYELARCQDSAPTAADLKERLDMSIPYPRSVQQVTRRLRSTACFVEVYRGRYQLGRPITRRTVVVDSDAP
jgi:predicted nucleic acid-binding protein